MFGNQKMYKRGLADAMQAYEGFSEKQRAALEKLRQDVASGGKKLEDALAGLGDDLNGIYQYLDSREKAALYRLEASMDLKDLDEPEQQLLIAVLYQLADDEGDKLTDSQRAFIRSVQRYLGVINPQTSADLSVVGDIDSLDVQKAFLRTTLEFFYLQGGEEISEQQEDFLSNFSVNKKQAGIIENSVSRLYNAVGVEGIAEKYGYVAEEGAQSASEQNSDPTTWEEYIISSSVQIGKDETVIHKNKIVHINAEITCDGNLYFENCQIHYSESRQNKGRIRLRGSGVVDFSGGIVECHAYIPPKENSYRDWDLSGCSLVQAESGNSAAAHFFGCSLINCCQLVLGVDTIMMEQCLITNPGPALFYNIEYLNLAYTRIFLNEIPAFVPADELDDNALCVIRVKDLEMKQCEVSGVLSDGKPVKKPAFISITGKIAYADEDENDVEEFSIEHCLFHDTDQTLIRAEYDASCAIRRCAFERCTKSRGVLALGSVGYLCGNFYMINCRFDNCGSISLDSNSKHFSVITLCQFNGASERGTILIYGRGGVAIFSSEFNDWLGRKLGMLEKGDGFTNEAMITLEESYWATHSVEDCLFQAIHAEEQFIISGQCSDKTKATFANVKNCKFVGCSTEKSEFVPRQCGYVAELFRGIIVYRTKMTPALSIADCTGLENRRGETSSQVNIVPRTCGSSPESVVGPTDHVGLPA